MTANLPYATAGGGDDDGWGDDGYREAPRGNYEPPLPFGVSPGVSPGVSAGVSPGVSAGVSPAGPGVFSPGAGEYAWGNVSGPAGLPGTWRTAPAEQDPVPAARPALPPVVVAIFTSRLLGGGPNGLQDQLRHPEPGTWDEHRDLILTHPWRPGGDLGRLFDGIYWTATGPGKFTGKSLVSAGRFLIWAGTRVDWLSERFMRVVIVAVILGVIGYGAFLFISY